MTELLDELRTAFGPAAVLDPADMANVLVGYRGVHRGDAVAVVRPGTTEEVAEVVRLCARHAAAVVTQGGNTGLAGGSVPADDGSARPSVVVLLSRLARIEPVSTGASSVTVEVGATVEAVQRAAHGAGLMFAPDWGARGTATIGGAISTNAGGINVLAYGPMRNHVLGLEVVLADGRIWNGLRSLRKDSSGYDLKQLFIGAEGTLGIITRATLALMASITHESTAFAAIRSTSDLAELMAMARAGTDGTLTALELIPDMGIEAVGRKFARARPLATRAEWYLLVRYGGSSPVEQDLAEFLGGAVDRGLITDAVVAGTTRQSDELWFIRDELSPPGLIANFELAVKMDSAVPVDRIAEFIESIEETCRSVSPAGRPYIFGHVGDGNLHIHVLPPDSQADMAEFLGHRPALYAALDNLTWSMGGSISGEHGVGQELRTRIVGQKPPVEFDLMRDIKHVLDPHDTLNPGKTIPADPRQ